MAQKTTKRKSQGTAKKKNTGTAKKSSSTSSARKTSGTSAGTAGAARSTSGSRKNAPASKKTAASGKKGRASSSRKGTSKNAKVPEGTDHVQDIELVLFLLLCIVLFLSMIDKAGQFGIQIHAVMSGLFGTAAYLFPFFLAVVTGWLYIRKKESRYTGPMRGIAVGILWLSICGLFGLMGGKIFRDLSVPGALIECYRQGGEGISGGIAGGLTYLWLVRKVGMVVTYLILVAVLLISFMAASGIAVLHAVRNQMSDLRVEAREQKAIARQDKADRLEEEALRREEEEIRRQEEAFEREQRRQQAAMDREDRRAQLEQRRSDLHAQSLVFGEATKLEPETEEEAEEKKNGRGGRKSKKNSGAENARTAGMEGESSIINSADPNADDSLPKEAAAVNSEGADIVGSAEESTEAFGENSGAPVMELFSGRRIHGVNAIRTDFLRHDSPSGQKEEITADGTISRESDTGAKVHPEGTEAASAVETAGIGAAENENVREANEREGMPVISGIPEEPVRFYTAAGDGSSQDNCGKNGADPEEDREVPTEDESPMEDSISLSGEETDPAAGQPEPSGISEQQDEETVSVSEGLERVRQKNFLKILSPEMPEGEETEEQEGRSSGPADGGTGDRVDTQGWLEPEEELEHVPFAEDGENVILHPAAVDFSAEESMSAYDEFKDAPLPQEVLSGTRRSGAMDGFWREGKPGDGNAGKSFSRPTPVTAPGALQGDGRRNAGSSMAAGTPVPEAAVVKKDYRFPPMTLLKEAASQDGTDREQLERIADKLEETLRSFGVGVKVTDISCGPSVTRYELQPDQGVKVSRIVGLADDIKLNLAAADIRIEAPIPGKAAVGIEVPNEVRKTVTLRELVKSEEFGKTPSRVSFCVGRDIAGKVIVADLARMPHLLIAGATGSGKSVCINSIIVSILYKASPEEVKLIMIDPKVVELSVYNGIPHLLIPVVTDPRKAAGALNWAVAEMTKRYQQFAATGSRDIKSFNRKAETDPALEKMPQIVVIVDELADLMMVSANEVEEAICRLAQLARAAGIHLVLATQRPSVNVITGLIKANVPSRIAFAVSSGVDSRTIIDMYGAEKLLGNGDMLFYPSGYPKPVRVQGAFVSDSEVSDIVGFLTENGEEPAEKNEELEREMTELPMVSRNTEVDELFRTAGEYIIDKEKASIGNLQRAFRIGFNRAARIMDQLCDYGVVGPEEGTKARQILMNREQFEELLRHM